MHAASHVTCTASEPQPPPPQGVSLKVNCRVNLNRRPPCLMVMALVSAPSVAPSLEDDGCHGAGAQRPKAVVEEPEEEVEQDTNDALRPPGTRSGALKEPVTVGYVAAWYRWRCTTSSTMPGRVGGAVGGAEGARGEGRHGGETGDGGARPVAAAGSPPFSTVPARGPLLGRRS